VNDIAKRAIASAGAAVRRLNPGLFGPAVAAPDRPSPHSEQQRDPVDVGVAADAGEAVDQVRSVVRVTSYRLRLLDERNLWDKHCVDALSKAGAIVDDSKKWATVHVGQVKVASAEEERTVIEIWKL